MEVLECTGAAGGIGQPLAMLLKMFVPTSEAVQLASHVHPVILCIQRTVIPDGLIGITLDSMS